MVKRHPRSEGSDDPPRVLPRVPGVLLTLLALLTVILPSLAASPAAAGEWPAWRGPDGDAVSDATGLVSQWSQEGENLIWRRDFTGRSTPVVFDGKVCAQGRVGEGITRQEMVACFDAETGEPLWEHRFNVYHTTVPWNRVGWANPTADPETGYLYVQGVGGLFFCFDSDTGEIVWSRNLVEDFGFMEGYGGRTQTPTVDEDRLIVHFANNSWGAHAIPRHRVFAFDKRTGEVLWTASPASSMADKNTQSTPAIALVQGERLVIAGNGDGWIYAHQARTGKKVWGFHLSKRGINTSVVVDGETVYAAHSEENIDAPTMGRVVAIDATGEGDVTKTHERWRSDVGAGFSSPVLHDGRLYVVDNSANLHALKAADGSHLWELSLGRVGKGSPVWADGKLYVTEVNGNFHIVKVGAEGGEILDTEYLEMPSGRYAEVYGSPAIAYGRVYFATEEGLYCIGDAEAEFSTDGDAEGGMTIAEAGALKDAAPVTLLAMPAEIELTPGQSVQLRTETFDPLGRSMGPGQGVAWSLDGLRGTVEDGRFTADPAVAYQVGQVVAKQGSLTGIARVRVIRPLPMKDDFESYEAGSRPQYLFSAVGRFEVQELEEAHGGGKALAKPPSPAKLHRHHTLIGRSEARDYTIQADILGTHTGRRISDVGLVNSGYVADLKGASQALELRSWAAELRMAQEVDFAWQPGTWYTMKFQVVQQKDSALVRAKVWPKGEDEPAEWTLSVEDPLPIRHGSPGLIGYTPSPGYWDNLEVTPNAP